MMQRFNGFSQRDHQVRIPATFFSELLPIIDDLDELKITVYALWALQQKDRDEFRYLRHADFTAPEVIHMHGLDPEALEQALAAAVERQTLLRAEITLNGHCETLYFANSPTGQAAIAQIQEQRWQPGDHEHPIQILPERPTIYKLYEDNFGGLTPMIAEELKDAEREFGAEWLRDAIQISVEMNKRNLRYVRAILERWKKDGKREDGSRRDRQDDEAIERKELSDLLRRRP